MRSSRFRASFDLIESFSGFKILVMSVSPSFLMSCRIHGRTFYSFVLCFLLVFSGEAKSALPNYFARSWRTDNGLPDNAVAAVTQTRDGYLWLGTYGGLVRFDGSQFTVFNSANEPGLQSDRITAVYEDAKNDLWIGHERGDLTRYHNNVFEPQNVHGIGARRKVSGISTDAAGD